MSSVLCESGGETRSPPASPVQSPPRKKFKFSLKLKPKKKGHGKIAGKENSVDENKEEVEDCKQKGESEISGDLTTNGTYGRTSILDTLPSVVPEIDTPLPFAGLANLGNTCYLNAVLQVLRYCPEFLKSLENLDEISSRDSHATSTADESNISVDEDMTLLRPSIINCIHKLACEMANAEENYHNLGMEAEEVKKHSGCTTLAVRPREFVKDFSGLRPMFGGYEQHDAQEFLRSLLSLVEEDCVGLDKSSDKRKDNMKENVIPSSTYDSKVRGGSKSPHCKTGDIIKTVAEPTSLILTTESRRNDNDCPEDQNSTRAAPSLNKTFIPKCFDKDLNCPKCVASDEMNMVKRLFEGKLVLQTCCLNCEGVRQRYENFQDISVPVMNTKQEYVVSNVEETVSMVSDSEDESENDVHLSWAISKFASVERLQGENKYFCDSCATLTEAEISTYFEELPQVLTIHLKRFQTCYGQSNFLSTSWITKVTKSLHTPQQLSLTKWCSKTCRDRSAVYKLFGVVMHSGMSSCSGHYLSYVNIQLQNEQGDRGLMGDTRESKCSCQDRNPEWPDASGESDGVKEKMIGLKDGSSMKSTSIGIGKYFQIFRKSKASAQESTNMDNTSYKKDADHPNHYQASRRATSTTISANNGASQPQENKIDQQTQVSVPDPLTESHCSTTERECLQMPKKDNSFSSSEAKWLKFDDAEVQEISQKVMAEILSPSSSCYSTPYLLFYFRS